MIPFFTKLKYFTTMNSLFFLPVSEVVTFLSQPMDCSNVFPQPYETFFPLYISALRHDIDACTSNLRLEPSVLTNFPAKAHGSTATSTPNPAHGARIALSRRSGPWPIRSFIIGSRGPATRSQ